MERLRERKKRITKTTLQAQAMKLFALQGYTATTIEQIASAADVSPSTFFRYFPTKESVVMYDSLDPLLVDAFYRQPAHLNVVQALRAASKEVSQKLSAEKRGTEQERARLICNEPALRMHILDEMVRNIDLLARIIAKRTGRKVQEASVRNLAAAIIGVMMDLFLGNQPPEGEQWSLFDGALASIESGIEML